MARTSTPIALFLKSLTTLVDIFSATAPSARQVLTATDSTHATWKDPVKVLALSANSATPAVNTDLYNCVHITNQTATITGFTMTGTPKDGETLRISITGTASVPFTLGTSFEAGAVPLGTTTSGTTRLDM